MYGTFTRELGRSGIQVSAMGLGCWAIGGPLWDGEDAVGWGEVDDNESVRAIHCALDHGVTFFDTADVYGAGHSERVLGRALTGRRGEVTIATKFGNRFDETARRVTGSEASRAYILRACEDSLRRLGTDTIDLYQFHLNDYDPVQAVRVRDVLEELVAAGKIRRYAWSTDHPERARVFAEGPNCTAVQFQMNVLEDAGPMVALCEELGLAGINRGPLAMGLLTGKYRAGSLLSRDDVRGEKSPGWMKYFQDGRPAAEWLEKLAAVREILTSGGRTLAQGALAWIWGRSERTIPIPGFRTVAQVEENCGAMAFGPLTAAQLGEIDRLLGR
jgi:aryl-alcohol dehydrogenase-like predicted oxidoreductase